MIRDKFAIVKPLLDWFDEWADYKTTRIDSEHLLVEDLQLNEKHTTTIDSRVERIEEYIYDEFQDNKSFDMQSKRYVEKITKRFESIKKELKELKENENL